MAEILILWLLGLIVVAIAWGVIDRITVPFKALAQSLRAPQRSKRVEIVVATLLALAVLSIMVATANHLHVNTIIERSGLQTLLIWAGGLWFVPFQFDDVGHYWLAALAIALTLILFWVWGTASPSPRTHAPINVSPQPGQDTTAGATGLGFLLWIVLIGLTVTAIARYTSMGNAVALNS
ncbi:MAG: hypothetical protein A4E19_19955 [Nitrospira sp. SG-bin1]|nr:MAG: hypothetical protein A4E19_19955 [Nitrospira sp. SG-bin1]